MVRKAKWVWLILAEAARTVRRGISGRGLASVGGACVSRRQPRVSGSSLALARICGRGLVLVNGLASEIGA